LLDRYRPIEYAVVDDREFLGLNSWQFALVVAGVILGIVIIVSVIAVVIYRKKRLQLMHEMQKRQKLKR
jgi:H+/gluconate symporter-like permease